MLRTLGFCLVGLSLFACGDDSAAPDGGGIPSDDAGPFRCIDTTTRACVSDVLYTCVAEGEFLRAELDDCRAHDPPERCIGDEETGFRCAPCRPREGRCMDNLPQICADDGSMWVDQPECVIEDGFACRDGACVNLCQEALDQQSYLGCEFYGVDLDNAAISGLRNAAAQQYAIVVSNPGQIATPVWVEINEAPFGSAPMIREIERSTVLGGDLEVFELPAREVDGASSNELCLPGDRTCSVGGETCLCSRGDTEPPCFCRNSPTASGLNDGTHTAVTSNAYRVRSSLPIIAYQFNPLDNVQVFSNDASLLLPTSAIDTTYTVAGWPQTIADGLPSMPDRDFDPGSVGEDLRATLTVVGTAPSTMVTFEIGRQAARVVAGGPVPEMTFFDTFTMEIGQFDVINLETALLNSDFTGTLVRASAPVVVFSGSEASDAPRFETYATRQCCADHLEEQLLPDAVLGQRFIIGRNPPRTTALNAAFVDPTRDSVPEVNEPEWVRVVAVDTGTTTLTTTLPPPDDVVTIGEREAIIFRANQDFILDADQPVSVLQVTSSQEAVGIDQDYPGGDPDIIVVPPVEQYRQDYVFLTPDLYAFDFVTITAPRIAQIVLDGAPLDPLKCTTGPADGIPRMPADPPPDWVVHRCQLSFPEVLGRRPAPIEDGDQDDGVHTIVASEPVGIIVSGFDSFVSYAYPGGLDLEFIN